MARRRRPGIAKWFVEHRLADGGWNCEWVEGSTRSSFHSTLNSLKGLLAYDAATGGTDATRAARLAGRGVPPASADCSAACRRANRSVRRSIHFGYPVPLGLQRAQRRRLLPGVVPSRWCGAGPADGRGDRAHPCCKAIRRQVASGRSAFGSCVVRDRRTGGAAVEIADPVWHTSTRLVGQRARSGSKSIPACLTLNLGLHALH